MFIYLMLERAIIDLCFNLMGFGYLRKLGQKRENAQIRTEKV